MKNITDIKHLDSNVNITDIKHLDNNVNIINNIMLFIYDIIFYDL